MSTGISLHIGLNKVNPAHYGGWDGKLAACEFDAKDMQAIARKRGYKTKLLLTKTATHANVVQAITNAAATLAPGDQFLLTYSGHGGQVPDNNGDEHEDTMDETWVLYDRQLVDDELAGLWSRFEQGVRILMLSDSCHSGTVSRAILTRRALGLPAAALDNATIPGARLMPPSIQRRTYRKSKRYYDKVQRDNPAGQRVAIGATVVLISGCQDSQYSLDGPRNGLFTGTLRNVWKNGQFKGSHRRLHTDIVKLMPPHQTPNYTVIGAPGLEFERKRPFTL